MEYAVIKTGGKQYRVKEGDEFDIEKLNVSEGEETVFPEVLLYKSDGKLKLGKPLLKEVKVKAKVIKQHRGRKIKVARFRAKKRHHKVKGHRQYLTRVKILKINNSGKSTDSNGEN